MSVVQNILDTVKAKLVASNKLIIAVSGPQGSGKTTVCKEAASALCDAYHIEAVAVSLDDFYRPHCELKEIAKRGNPLLKHRGLPGTHDTQLLYEFLKAFKAGAPNLSFPIYDKSLFHGAGDRSGFKELPDKTSVILLEGWMVGFQPVGDKKLQEKGLALLNEQWSVKPELKDLEEIETHLRNYQAIWGQFDAFVTLVPKELRYIYEWRLQQEHELIAKRGIGMTDPEVKGFVDQYMPCYYIYNETLPSKNALKFELDENHHAQMLQNHK